MKTKKKGIKLVYKWSLSVLFFMGALNIVNAQINITQIDPGLEGSFEFETADYDLAPINLPSFPGYDFDVEAVARIPKGSGSFPLIIVLHGRHNTCYVFEGSKGFIEFPCGSSQATNEIPNHLGYNYLLDFLASHGYIAVSIDSNDILRAVQLENPQDFGMQARAELIQHHLDLWNSFNTESTSIFGSKYNNKIDLDNIITVGHSRGGEGVVKHFSHNRNLGSPYTIKGVFGIAPSNYNNLIVPGMTYAVMLPYCDGDLPDLPGSWNYDRQTENSDMGTHQVLLKGANHNYFNTVWSPGGFVAGTADDWETLTENSSHKGEFCGNNANRFGQNKQRNTLKAYLHSFIKNYIGKNPEYTEPILGTNKSAPSSTQLGDNEVHVSYQAPNVKKAILHRVSDLLSTDNTSSGGEFSHSGLENFSVCGSDGQDNTCGPLNSGFDDHRSEEFSTGLARIIVSWETPGGWFEQTVPSPLQNTSNFSHLTFRAGVTAQPPFRINSGQDKNFTIRMTDISGNNAATEVTNFSTALYAPRGTFGTVTPHNVANTIAIPLSEFNTINLNAVTTIRFIFDKSNSGEIYFTDFAFTNYNKDINVLSTNEISIITKDNGLKLFPNPAIDYVNLEMSEFITDIKIMDLKGKLVYVKNHLSEQQFSIPVSNLSKGMYLIAVNQKYTNKLIIR